MLKHQAATIDRLTVLAPTPIRVDLLILAATATLLNVEMITFVIQIHDSSAPVAPNDSLARPINLEVEHRPVPSKYELLTHSQFVTLRGVECVIPVIEAAENVSSNSRIGVNGLFGVAEFARIPTILRDIRKSGRLPLRFEDSLLAEYGMTA